MPAEFLSYDSVPYPGHAYRYTHPDNLATIGALHGMRPPAIDRCRVLELGCGEAINLVAMAEQLPQSEFVGIDLSGGSIAKGRTTVAALGMTNISLHECSILDVGAAFGRFDYIIAHGVYSWVPAEVREKILAVFRDNLSPQGIAYISFNAYPGAHLRNLARDIMLFHIRGVTDPAERVEQARAALRFAAEAADEADLYGALLRDEVKRVEQTLDEVLLHDDLDEASEAFTLLDVTEAARRHGLDYLSEATISRADPRRFSARARTFLDQLPDDYVVEREQYADFIKGHRFRRVLLCHAGASPRRQPAAEGVPHLYFATPMKPGDPPPDAPPGATTFQLDKGGGLTTNHPLSQVALALLIECWPKAVAYSELLDAAVARLPPDSDVRAGETGLLNTLFQAAIGGYVECQSVPSPLTTEISARPEASPLARLQAARGAAMVTSLRQGMVLLEDPTTRAFLRLLDGTRTIDDLVRDLSAELKSSQAASHDVTRAEVEAALGRLARIALLRA